MARELAPVGLRSGPKKGLLRSPTGASPLATEISKTSTATLPDPCTSLRSPDRSPASRRQAH
ncbi:hypothetical protein FFH90_023705 [Pseudomonas sp. ATCC 43928]|nr:hypothetical protein FFH90_023705 [Pseudomonas sp. ATCC 43928]